MKSFTSIVAVALAAAVPALAQSVLDIPKCAQNAVLLAIGASGCSPTDFECICKKDSFIDGLVNTIPSLCTPEETYDVSTFAIVFCQATGVEIDLPASIQAPTGVVSTTASVATTSSTVVVTTASTSTSVSVSTSLSVSVSVTLVNATISNTISSTGSSTSSRAAVTTSAPVSSVTSTVPPNAGAVQTAGLVGLMGAVMVGVMGL